MFFIFISTVPDGVVLKNNEISLIFLHSFFL